MAIWQFNLTAIPRKGVLEKYEVIPKTLDRSFFEDLNLWASTSLDINTLIGRIDKIVKRADYGDENWFNWKTQTEEVDNDASLLLNTTTKKIEYLHFRADLREEKLVYLNEVIRLATDYDWMFVDL